MYGHEGNTIRSRYDYYYSVSSPSLCRATSFFEKKPAGLFEDALNPLFPIPAQPQLPTKYLPPLSPGCQSTSSAPLIDNFDNHLYESIKRNNFDCHINNSIATERRKKLWAEKTPVVTPPPGSNEWINTRMSNYLSQNDYNVHQNKFRAVSANNYSSR